MSSPMSARGTQCTSREPLFTSEHEWGAYMHCREASHSANDLQLHGAALRKLRVVNNQCSSPIRYPVVGGTDRGRIGCHSIYWNGASSSRCSVALLPGRLWRARS